MADRYLLESGAPDGYLLEDGTGVLILDAAATFPGDDSEPPGTLGIAGAARCWSLSFWAVTLFLGGDVGILPSTIDEAAYQPPPQRIERNKWFQVDDPSELSFAPVALQVDDSDGWWLGPQPKLGVGSIQPVPVWGYDPGDLGFLTVDDSDGWWLGPRPQLVRTPPVQAVTDTDVLSWAFDSEDYWLNWVRPQYGWTPKVDLWAWDEQIPGNLHQFPAVDEDFWAPPAPWRQLTQQLWIDDDVGSTPRLVDTEFYLPPPPWRIATQQYWIDDAGDASVPRYISEDYWDVRTIPPTPTVVRVWYGDEEIVAVAALAGDEGEWIPPVLRQPTWRQPILADEDTLAFLYFDEGEWIPPVVPAPIRYRQPITSDEDVLFWQVAEVYHWQAQRQVVPWTAQPFSDDEVWIAQPAVPAEAEWLQPLVQPAQWQVRVWWGDEEVVPQPAPIWDEYGWPKYYVAPPPWVARVWYGEEETVIGAAPAIHRVIGSIVVRRLKE